MATAKTPKAETTEAVFTKEQLAASKRYAKRRDLITVSYTHLDVYKRQFLCSVEGQEAEYAVMKETGDVLVVPTLSLIHI